MPTRQGGRLASRASIWPRDHFWRRMMAPRLSWPTTWNEFLPMSMPITAIWALAVLGMGVLLLMQPQPSVARWRGRSTAGPSHYLKLAVLTYGQRAEINRAITLQRLVCILVMHCTAGRAAI